MLLDIFIITQTIIYMTLLPGVPGSRLSFQEEDVYDSRTDCLSLAVGLSTNSERSPPVLTG